MSLTKTRIKQLQQASLIAMVESIAVFIFSLFIALFLPQLLLTYVYANQQLFEQPAIFTYIPVVAFGLGAGYFLLAVVGNFIRSKKVRALLKEEEMNDCCGGDCGSCETNDTELKEMESMVDQMLAQAASAKKSSTKKATSKVKKSKKA